MTIENRQRLQKIIKDQRDKLSVLQKSLKDSPLSFQSHVDHSKGFVSGCAEILEYLSTDYDSEVCDMCIDFNHTADLMVTHLNNTTRP